MVPILSARGYRGPVILLVQSCSSVFKRPVCVTAETPDNRPLRKYDFEWATVSNGPLISGTRHNRYTNRIPLIRNHPDIDGLRYLFERAFAWSTVTTAR